MAWVWVRNGCRGRVHLGKGSWDVIGKNLTLLIAVVKAVWLRWLAHLTLTRPSHRDNTQYSRFHTVEPFRRFPSLKLSKASSPGPHSTQFRLSSSPLLHPLWPCPEKRLSFGIRCPKSERVSRMSPVLHSIGTVNKKKRVYIHLLGGRAPVGRVQGVTHPR